jgi:cytochrome oxidase Cu insertion factor (SCO1/SenC/PrrC family)
MNDRPTITNVQQQLPMTVENGPGGSAALPFVLALAMLVAMGYGGWKWWQVQRFEASRAQAALEDLSGPPITDFELTQRNGQPFRSRDMRGRVWVATYFFTTCPGSCIRLNRNIQLMHNLPELGDITWVSITCDPDTDTLDALRDYAERWQADPDRWLFCRAELDYIRRIAKGMNLFLSRKGHQDYAVVFDKAGKIRGMYNATSKSESQRLRGKLAELLKEEPPREFAAADAAKHAS